MLKVLLLLALVVGAVTVWISSRRKRKYYARHPEERPTRAQRLLRGAPFVVLGGACSVYGFVNEDLPLMFEGGGAAFLLGLILARDPGPRR